MNENLKILNDSIVENTVTDSSQEFFLKQYLIFIKKILNALEQIQQENSSMKVEFLRENVIKISIEKIGIYFLDKDVDNRLLTLTSPVSGYFKYKFDDSSNYWLNEKDKHIIDELLIREFCKHSNGILNL